MRIIVCGGRDFMDKELMDKTLPLIIKKIKESKEINPLERPVIVEGEARGADTLARQWAEENGHEVEPHPAKWDEHGKAAGAIRNIEMLSTGVDGVIAYPGGPGTKHMITIAEAAGVPVYNVYIGGLTDNEEEDVQDE